MNGRTQTGVAFAASVRAYEQHRIRRHELTRPDKENDRVRNIATLNAQTGPVLLAYRANDALRDLLATATNAAPLFSVTGPNDVVHTVWDTAPATDATSGSGARRTRSAVHRRRPSPLRRRGSRRGAAARLSRCEPRVLPRRRVSARRDAHPRLQPRRPRSERPVARSTACAHPRIVHGRGRGGRPIAGAARDLRDVSRRQVVRAEDSPRSRAAQRSRREPRREPAARPSARAALEYRRSAHRRAHRLRGRNPGSARARAARAVGPRGRRVRAAPDAHGAADGRRRCGQAMPPKSTWFEPKLADGLLSHVLD